jgi:hypothetical protein
MSVPGASEVAVIARRLGADAIPSFWMNWMASAVALRAMADRSLSLAMTDFFFQLDLIRQILIVSPDWRRLAEFPSTSNRYQSGDSAHGCN